jgi:hypothetical protein
MLFFHVDPPPKKLALLFHLIRHTPIKNRGLSVNP